MNNSLESKLELEGVFVHDKKVFEDIPTITFGIVEATEVKVAVITTSIDGIHDQSKAYYLAIVNFSINGVISEYARFCCILGGKPVWMTEHRIKTDDRGDGWLEGYLEAKDPDCKDDFFAGMESFIKERYLLPMISKEEPSPKSKLSRLTKIFSSKK